MATHVEKKEKKNTIENVLFHRVIFGISCYDDIWYFILQCEFSHVSLPCSVPFNYIFPLFLLCNLCCRGWFALARYNFGVCGLGCWRTYLLGKLIHVLHQRGSIADKVSYQLLISYYDFLAMYPKPIMITFILIKLGMLMMIMMLLMMIMLWV